MSAFGDILLEATILLMRFFHTPNSTKPQFQAQAVTTIEWYLPVFTHELMYYYC
jgi:hypothetical protein